MYLEEDLPTLGIDKAEAVKLYHQLSSLTRDYEGLKLKKKVVIVSVGGGWWWQRRWWWWWCWWPSTYYCHCLITSPVGHGSWNDTCSQVHTYSFLPPLHWPQAVHMGLGRARTTGERQRGGCTPAHTSEAPRQEGTANVTFCFALYLVLIGSFSPSHSNCNKEKSLTVLFLHIYITA